MSVCVCVCECECVCVCVCSLDGIVLPCLRVRDRCNYPHSQRYFPVWSKRNTLRLHRSTYIEYHTHSHTYTHMHFDCSVVTKVSTILLPWLCSLSC